MQLSFQLRNVKAEEIPLIRKLALQIWPTAFEEILSGDQIKYMLEMMYSESALLADAARGVEFYILNYENEDCGYAAIEKLDDHSYKLHKIYLSQKLHGKGLGKWMIIQMEQISKNRGATILKLNVNRENKAVDFYKSQGYEIIKTEDINIGNGYFMNDFVMAKKI